MFETCGERLALSKGFSLEADCKGLLFQCHQLSPQRGDAHLLCYLHPMQVPEVTAVTLPPPQLGLRE